MSSEIQSNKVFNGIFFQQCQTEMQKLQEQNYQLQHKLADYFRRKKSEEAQRDVDKNVTDQEQRYLKYMGTSFSSEQETMFPAQI